MPCLHHIHQWPIFALAPSAMMSPPKINRAQDVSKCPPFIVLAKGLAAGSQHCQICGMSPPPPRPLLLLLRMAVIDPTIRLRTFAHMWECLLAPIQLRARSPIIMPSQDVPSDIQQPTWQQLSVLSCARGCEMSRAWFTTKPWLSVLTEGQVVLFLGLHSKGGD